MINLYNGDCMEAMQGMEDNQYDLAIVDPPYGKKPTRDNKGNGGFNNSRNYDNKADIWDIKPSKLYFSELYRVSRNQIIWGANYFIEYLRSSNSWVSWDKKNGENIFSDFELAFTSFSCRSMLLSRATNKNTQRFHPTEKPIFLYKWLLKNYAKEGDKILDTHLGSGSIALACHDMKFDLDGWEIDKDYYNAMMKRYNNHIKQLTLF